MTALALDQWGRFLPEHTTAVSLLDRPLHHSIVVVTEASRSAWAKAEHGQEAASPKPETERWGTFTWPPPATRVAACRGRCCGRGGAALATEPVRFCDRGEGSVDGRVDPSP
jgi:hypothetical protein